jgi:hypothetical protein
MGTRGKGEFDTGMSNAEKARLTADAQREANWKRWGPYLAERQAKTDAESSVPKGSTSEQARRAPQSGVGEVGRTRTKRIGRTSTGGTQMRSEKDRRGHRYSSPGRTQIRRDLF